MGDWENLRHFAALARSGSLSAAARQLRVEHATVARRVAALEAELDLKLVDRRGRRLVLTGDGARIAAMAERMAAEALAIARAAAGARTTLSGTVSLSAPPAFAAAFLVQRLTVLQQRHPALQLRLLGETRAAALERREADLAIRLSRPSEGALALRRIGRMRFRAYASPAYLASVAPADWRVIAYDETMDAAPQQAALLRRLAGHPIALRASTAEVQLAAARAGAGVAMLPAFLAADDPGLAPAEPDAAPVERGIWLVVHTDLRTAPAIRAVLDALAAGPPIEA